MSASAIPLPGPRWYGFNLLEYFSIDIDWMRYFPYKNDGLFPEDDFRWMAEWGFNFCRLPMDYRFWTDPQDMMTIREQALEPIDRAIGLGHKYDIHVCLNLHHAPGFCIVDSNADNPLVHVTTESTSYYDNAATRDAFVHQWALFADRYRGIPGEQLSFNLVNEPLPAASNWSELWAAIESEKLSVEELAGPYIDLAQTAIDAIRARDSERWIISDGFLVGRAPLPQLAGPRVMQSCRGYTPSAITHYRCEWASMEPDPQYADPPTWPLATAPGEVAYDRAALGALYRPWAEAAEEGIPIHCGECGCYKNTPHSAMLGWFEDLMGALGDIHCGWALWNLRGPFGVLDTMRNDVDYADWHGHALDRQLLEMLQGAIIL